MPSTPTVSRWPVSTTVGPGAVAGTDGDQARAVVVPRGGDDVGLEAAVLQPVPQVRRRWRPHPRRRAPGRGSPSRWRRARRSARRRRRRGRRQSDAQGVGRGARRGASGTSAGRRWPPATLRRAISAAVLGGCQGDHLSTRLRSWLLWVTSRPRRPNSLQWRGAPRTRPGARPCRRRAARRPARHGDRGRGRRARLPRRHR